MVMSMESRKILNNGKPIAPKAPIRSKSGPYLAPRLASSLRVTPETEPRKASRVAGTEVNAKLTKASDITTPVKSFLATNVTPRSSSRRSRAASGASTPSSTPGGTPSGSRPESVTVPDEQIQGLGIRSGSETRNTIESFNGNFTTPSASRNAQTLDAVDTDSFKFFHASDANAIPKKIPQTIAKTGSGFMYADGRREEPAVRTGSRVGSRPASQVGAQNKIYTPNGQSGPSSVMHQSPKNISPATSPKLSGQAIPAHNYGSRHRSTSPLKEFETPGQQILTKARRVSGASAGSFAGTNKSTVSALPARTPQTIIQPESRMHVKTQSMSSLDAYIRPQCTPIQQNPALLEIHSPQSMRDLPISPSHLNITTTQATSPLVALSPLASPDRTASGSSNKIDQLNSMAANARRERKVLDLEISNSSLLAINRTLEREMRKQKIELRRYRRLTSGGRLSFAPTNRSVSGTTTISTLSFDSEPNFDSEEENTLTDIESEDEESSDSDGSLSGLSPEAQAAKDMRQRARDEKRLQLDLSKHQQLLIDSQRMNESLKRCLGWTEQLIFEGRKALEFRVQVGEVQLGGRVLHEDDNPDMLGAQPRHALLSPTHLSGPDDSLWASGGSPAGTIIHQSDNSYTSIMADEGKEFREYLDSLVEPGS